MLECIYSVHRPVMIFVCSSHTSVIGFSISHASPPLAALSPLSPTGSLWLMSHAPCPISRPLGRLQHCQTGEQRHHSPPFPTLACPARTLKQESLSWLGLAWSALSLSSRAFRFPLSVHTQTATPSLLPATLRQRNFPRLQAVLKPRPARRKLPTTQNSHPSPVQAAICISPCLFSLRSSI